MASIRHAIYYTTEEDCIAKSSKKIKFDMPVFENCEERFEPPASDSETFKKLFEDNDLRHGDVVNFAGNRDEYSFVVKISSEEGSARQLVQDKTYAGDLMLCIPSEITQQFTNYYEVYCDLINELPTIIIQVANDDEHIRTLCRIPKETSLTGYKFEIVYCGEYEDAVAVTTPDGKSVDALDLILKWRKDDQSKLAWADILKDAK
eukprot:Filipodium_phascolosomae@DN8183_c0_g1_i1.p1